MKIIIIYWILTTLYGVYWMVKQHIRKNKKEGTLGDVIEYTSVAMAFGWIFVPIYILSKIKIKL